MDLGPHVFPTKKYRLIAERLVTSAICAHEDFQVPGPISIEAVRRVHESGYVERIVSGKLTPTEIQQLELPMRPDLVEAFFLAAGGTLRACEIAMDGAGLAVNLSGGFHHAFRGHGEGFCLIHDVAIAVDELRARGRLERALLVDLDVHQGNGSASIYARDEDVFTLSMHQENNYPASKPPSDLDVGLSDRTGDALYLEALERHLPQVLDEHRPELVVYLAGADPYQADRLGGLGLSVEGLATRDRVVFEHCHRRRIPATVVLAGGYAQNTDDTVLIHVNTVREAIKVMAN